MPTIQLGRLGLVEIPWDEAQDTASTTQAWQLVLSGQQAYPVQTLAAVTAARDDINGLVGYLVPVTCTDKANLNGYYQVISSSANTTNWSNTEGVLLDWTVTLQRIGTDTEIDLEARLTGAAVVNNSFAVTAGEQWSAPPIGHYGFWSGPSEPSTMTRTSMDGPITIYRQVPLVSTVRWGCPVGSYGGGRVRFLDANGIERSGLNFTTSATGWQLHNGIVAVAAGSGHTLDVSAWTGGAWQAKGWNLQFGSPLVSLGAPSSVTLLRNDYEAATARVLWDTAPGRITADLVLRRGSRFLELYVQSETSTSLKLVRSTAEGGTGSTGYVTAAAADGAGNRYVVGSAHTATQDTTTGGLSVSSATTMDAYLGVVIASAPSGDQAADLWAQYLGRRAIYVQGVRR